MSDEELIYAVVCRADRLPSGKKNGYELATRRTFKRQLDAVSYAAGISPSREPIVVSRQWDKPAEHVVIDDEWRDGLIGRGRCADAPGPNTIPIFQTTHRVQLGYDTNDVAIFAGDLIRGGDNTVRVLRHAKQQPTDDRGICFCVVEPVGEDGWDPSLGVALRTSPLPAGAPDHWKVMWRLLGSHAPAQSTPQRPTTDVFEALDEWL